MNSENDIMEIDNMSQLLQPLSQPQTPPRQTPPQTPPPHSQIRILSRNDTTDAMDTSISSLSSTNNRKPNRCSYCRMSGHNRRYCLQREYDDKHSPNILFEEIKLLDRKILRHSLERSHISEVLRDVDIHIWPHLWKWLFPHSRKGLPTDMDGCVCFIQIRNNIIDEYMYMIQDHPQWEDRSKDYERKQATLKKMHKNYERYNSAINERIREHQREIMDLQNDLRDYVNSYNVDCEALRKVPRLKEFQITHLIVEPTKYNIARMEVEETEKREPFPKEQQCPICLNDFDNKQIIYVECSGVHHMCYDCTIMLTQSQEEPKCPMCRDTIHSMGCLNREICVKLADRFMI